MLSLVTHVATTFFLRSMERRATAWSSKCPTSKKTLASDAQLPINKSPVAVYPSAAERGASPKPTAHDPQAPAGRAP